VQISERHLTWRSNRHRLMHVGDLMYSSSPPLYIIINSFLGAGFRMIAFGFSALSPFLSISRSLLLALSLPEAVSLLLLAEWRLSSRLSTESIRLRCSLI
jgi:hypothetical protein